MLSKCAIPGCTERFLHLKHGTLFQFEVHTHPGHQGKKPPGRVIFVWLCRTCSTRWNITSDFQGALEIKVKSDDYLAPA